MKLCKCGFCKERKIDITHGRCHCGCGKKTTSRISWKISTWLKGHHTRGFRKYDKEYIKKHTGFVLNGRRSVCWLSTSAVAVNGYVYCDPGSHLGERLAHRYMYKKYIGPIAKNKELDHLCAVKNCIRPTHLEAVKHKYNCQRTYIRDPYTKASVRKLTDSQVLKIRKLNALGWSYADLGRRFKAFSASIRKICLGKTYKHLLEVN